MSLYLAEASLDVYQPDASDPHLTIDGASGDLASVELTSRIQDRKDSASIQIHNDHGNYSDQITRGDKLVFEWTESAGAAQMDARYGHFHYGQAHYGGAGGYRSGSWTGMVTGDIELDIQAGGGLGMTVPASDFVFAVLADRNVHNAFKDRQIAGTSDSIVNTVVENEAPEIDRSGIESITDTLDIFADGTNLLEFLADVASEADAVMSADGTTLNFEPMSDLEPEYELLERQWGTGSVRISDDNLRNAVRVDGGTDADPDESQTTQDGYTTVTDSSRITHQLSTRKATLDNIKVWTNPTGSEESVIVRFQKDDGGSPVNVSDESSDVENKELSHEFLADDDYTEFLLSDDHIFPEPQPWLIIESSGTAGQKIGINTATNEPTFKSEFQFPVAVEVSDQSSIDDYRRVEGLIQRDNLNTQAAARSLGDAVIAHDAQPEKTLTVDAIEPRAHRTTPATVVDTTYPDYTVDGEFICTERRQVYDGVTLDTELEFQEVASF